MRLDAWVWNMGDYTAALVPTDDTLLPLKEVCLKTHEASVWFSQSEITNLARIYRDQGITLSAWSVPLGYVDDVGNNVAVLTMLKNAGIERPYLQLDFEYEPTDDFWKGTAAQVHEIFRRTKAACPWAELGMCLYQFERSLGFITAVGLPECDRVVTMSYWTQFGTTAEQRLGFEWQHIRPYGKPWQVGVPGNSSPAMMTRGLDWIAANVEPAGLYYPPIVWRRGTTSKATWDAIAAYPEIGETEPQPEPPEPPEPPVPDPCQTLSLETTQWTVDDEHGAQLRSDRLVEIFQELQRWQYDDSTGAKMRRQRLEELHNAG